MMPVRIAISGKMGAGKSTLATHLSSHFNTPVVSFAAAFKDLIEAAGVTKERDEVLYRRLCQNIGGGLRTYDQNIWVKAFWDRFGAMASPHVAGCIVDDMRYPNELDSLTAGGFYTVRLEVPASIRARRRVLLDHESETALDAYAQSGRFHDQFYLDGNQSPEYVCNRVLETFAQWQERRS